MNTKSELLREANQDFDIENEEFIPFMFRGYETKYKISKYGNVLGVKGQKLKWFYHSTDYAGVGITIPKGSSDDGYVYANKAGKKNHEGQLTYTQIRSFTFFTFSRAFTRRVKKRLGNYK